MVAYCIHTRDNKLPTLYWSKRTFEAWMGSYPMSTDTTTTNRFRHLALARCMFNAKPIDWYSFRQSNKCASPLWSHWTVTHFYTTETLDNSVAEATGRPLAVIATMALRLRRWTKASMHRAENKQQQLFHYDTVRLPVDKQRTLLFSTFLLLLSRKSGSIL